MYIKQIEKFFLYVFASILLGTGIYSGLHDNGGIASIMFTAMGGILIFARLDMIAEFEWWGGKAKTREVVNEAKATIDQIRKLAVVLSDAAITGMITSGRWGGGDIKIQDRVRRDVTAILKELGVKNDDINRAQSTFLKYVAYDHARNILRSSPNRPSSPEITDQWNDLTGRVSLDSELPSPQEFDNFFSNFGLLTQEVKERIEDYRYFIKHQEFRDIKRF